MASSDIFAQAHADALNAVKTFLPSLFPAPPQPPVQPPPPGPMTDAVKALSMARHVEMVSARVARGLPPEPPKPPTPEKAFGNVLDVVHSRAIQTAIAGHPETDQGRLISEAQDSVAKWIASHNGKVIVHGKVELAHTPEAAQGLAAKIVNQMVEEHDQRHADAQNPGDGSSQGRPDTGVSSASSGSLPAPTPQAVSGPAQPEVVPPGDGKAPAQGPAPEVKPAEAAKVGTDKPDGHQITQPKNSVPANQKLALEAAPELHTALQTIAGQVPGVQYARIRPQKATGRLEAKTDDNAPNTLSDYLGAQLSADSPQAKDQMVAALKKSFNVIEVDDKFLEGRKDKAHYPSTNVQVQLSNGSTAEVQIVPKEVQDRTDESHVFYKAGRDAEQRGDNEERDRQWAKAAKIHEGALAAFKLRNGLGTDKGNDARPPLEGHEAVGQPIRIGSRTFLEVRPKSNGATLPVPLEANGSQGPAMPSAGAGHDEQLPSGVPPGPVSSSDQPERIEESSIPEFSSDQVEEANDPSGSREAPGRASSGNPDSSLRPRSLAKGQVVQLKDGSEAQVAYADPNMNLVRVQVNGSTRVINPLKDLA